MKFPYVYNTFVYSKFGKTEGDLSKCLNGYLPGGIRKTQKVLAYFGLFWLSLALQFPNQDDFKHSR